MPLTSGRVTFTRFKILGDSPEQIDTTLIELLGDHAFQETVIGSPDEIEAGFVTTEHLFDTKFNAEKIAYQGAALFAIRIDTHKVPSEIKRAYQKQNEQGAADASLTGFASKAERREAKELAARQVQEDLASGKYRKSKSVQIAWRLGHKEIYLATTSGTVIEQFVRLMRRAFCVDLMPVTPGTWANEMRPKAYEDLLPTPFTKPPTYRGDGDDDAATSRERRTPICPWVTKTIDLKDFLGSEFLIWIWFCCETQEGIIEHGDRSVFLTILSSLDMACAWEVGGKQTLRVDKPTSLSEAHDALVSGKWPMKVGLILSGGDSQFDLTLCGQTLNASALRLPDIEDAQTPRDIITERLSLLYELNDLIGFAFEVFLEERLDDAKWKATTRDIVNWIKTRE